MWTRRSTGGVIGLAMVAVAVLALMGRRLWCKQGDLSLGTWEANSSHTSQHLLDPYTLTHLLHGVFFFYLLGVFLRSRSPEIRLLIAVGIEAAWEVLENTPMVIEKYRDSTISLDYFGDSVVNSIADIGACVLGYAFTAMVPAWAALAGFVAIELALLATIRDSLIVNVIMLIRPIEALKTWQAGG